MREMGLFGLDDPHRIRRAGESLLTYALCVEELACGWMSISGVINTHFIVAYTIRQHRHRRAEAALPAADGHRRNRGAFSMSEPEVARRRRHPNPRRSQRRRQLHACTARRCGSPTAEAPHSSPHWSALTKARDARTTTSPPSSSKAQRLRRSRTRLTIPGKLDKLGYKGIDTTELDLRRIPCRRRRRRARGVPGAASRR